MGGGGGGRKRKSRKTVISSYLYNFGIYSKCLKNPAKILFFSLFDKKKNLKRFSLFSSSL